MQKLNTITNNWKRYILWFAQEHVDFRDAEIQSIVKLFGLQYRRLQEDALKPFWIVELPNDDSARKLASRSVSLRCIFELWSHSTKLSTFHDNIRSYIQHHKSDVQQHFAPESSFKITVETYNKHYSQAEKVKKIESFDYLPVQGNVELCTPHVDWWYIEFWGLDPMAVQEVPDLLFGRLLCKGQRHLVKELCLKKRKFIGNTSMDAQLSLLMANQALVSEGDIVFDPFVGTGSLLVSAAKFGGYVIGSDIDFMMLHARTRPSRITQKVREKDESIRNNLRQYGCEGRYLDVIVSDFSNPPWNEAIVFDSIITDPPYGIREATEKVEAKTNANICSQRGEVPHYPSKSQYTMSSLYADLLIFAAKYLKMGGRLVCWLPYHRADYTEQMAPLHKSLKLVANSEQKLIGMTARRLLTYEKHSDPSDDDQYDISGICRLETNFRQRYFDSQLETRGQRRQRRQELRQFGQEEARKHGKPVHEEKKIIKCNLNRARFS